MEYQQLKYMSVCVSMQYVPISVCSPVCSTQAIHSFY